MASAAKWLFRRRLIAFNDRQQILQRQRRVIHQPPFLYFAQLFESKLQFHQLYITGYWANAIGDNTNLGARQFSFIYLKATLFSSLTCEPCFDRPI